MSPELSGCTENIPRDAALFIQRKYCGQTLVELGKDFWMTNYSSVSSAVERTKFRLSKDKILQGKIDKITKKLYKSQRQT